MVCKNAVSNIAACMQVQELLELIAISIIYRCIIDPHNNQLPVGQIAQLVEHCIGIAEIRF